MDEPVWFNSLGERVDLDSIDKEYALNILSMYLLNSGKVGASHGAMRNDPLVAKLRDVVLHGREADAGDIARGRRYNERNKARGLPWRAPV